MTTAALWSLPGWVRAAGAKRSLYESSIVIEGLGGPERGDEPMTAEQVADVRASGLTAAHITVGTVGSMAPLSAFEQIVRSIMVWEAEIDRHPDVFMRVRSAVDIEAAKRAGRTGIAAPYETEDGYLFASDLNTPRRFEAIAEMLLARGHSADTVAKVLGGNLLRVFAEAWQPLAVTAG